MVKKYRKKPVVIETMLFYTNNEDDDVNMNAVVRWINEGGSHARHDSTDIYIKTLEGEMRAECGDYIIKGVKGEFYPCKPDIFKQTYEEVTPEERIVRGCCVNYGKQITDMMNEKFFKVIEEKDNSKFLDNLADVLFELTGNVNISQKLKNLI